MTEFTNVVSKLEARGIFPDSPPDLQRMKDALILVGFYQWPFWLKHKEDLKRIVVVAGTNGKGSTCATLSHLLTHAGERVGFYSSPHLVDYTERIRMGLEPIGHETFCRAFDAIEKKVTSIPLTHFELITLMALWIFCSDASGPIVDRLILEVGLGGTWDATNAVPHGLSVITRLGLDHENLLGKGIINIAKNKLGIISDNNTVVHFPFPNEILDLAQDVKRKTHSNFYECELYNVEMESGHPPITRLLINKRKIDLALVGKRGGENTSLALAVFKQLGHEIKPVLKFLESVKWEGRFELCYSKQGTPVYFSGDHNLQGIESLIAILQWVPRKNIFFVVGVGRDKDFKHIIEKLKNIKGAKIILTETPFKGLKINQYQDSDSNCLKEPDPKKAVEMAFQMAGKDDCIVITGSLYLVGDLKKFTAANRDV